MQQQKSTYSISFSIQNLVEAGSGTVLKVVGVIYTLAINGKVNISEVYGSDVTF